MDLRQVIIALLALVAVASGFLPTRKIRPRFFHRQPQRMNPKISMVTNLSNSRGRMHPSPHRAQNTGINQRFTLQSRPQNVGHINIFSNIILHPSTNNSTNPHQRHQNMPGQQNRGQGQGHQGQGRGHGGRQHKPGQRAAPYNVFNGIGNAGTGHPGKNGQPTRGRSRLAGVGNIRGSGHSGINPAAVRPLVGGAGNKFVPSHTGHGNGHRSLAQLTLPVLNRTDILSLFKSVPGSNNTFVGAKGGNPAQIVLIPQISNTGTLILSADTGLRYPGLQPKAGFGEALLVAGGSKLSMATAKPPGGSFISISTLKPGEDPPEVEHPSA